jgi:hypothetical protein
LKDLKTDSADLFCEAVSYEDLRKEAIKWVKFYSNRLDKIRYLYEEKAVKIFMNFFNLSEEDINSKRFFAAELIEEITREDLK